MMTSPRPTILCGVDGSAGGIEAARYAAVLAERLGLGLALAHASGGRRARAVLAPDIGRHRLERRRMRGRDLLRAAAAATGRSGTVLILRDGGPVEMLTDVAREDPAIALLVVGTGAGGGDAVARRLIMRAPCPVVLVPGDG